MTSNVPKPSRHLLLVVVPVCAAAFACFVAAAVAFASSPHSAVVLAGLGALLAAMMLADHFPVPLDGIDVAGVSLSFVFGVAAVVLFGWAGSVIVVVAAPAISQLVEQRPRLRIAYNASVHGLAAAAGGLLIAPIGGSGVGSVVARVALCAVAQHAVNALLVSGVVAVDSERSFVSVVRSNVRGTAVPFALMASASLMLVVLWQRSPILSLSLGGPLLAIALYQRSAHRALRAMRLALTDPLTGLGNHGHFHTRLRRELAEGEARGRALALCLVDIDDFKRINDRFGHPVGDRVLADVAAHLRQDGEAFRLGGDEFAVVMTDVDEPAALATATAIVERLGSLELGDVGSVTVSAGVAAYPAQPANADKLVHAADEALYWAKDHGKNRVGMTRSNTSAASLAEATDARDAHAAGHSRRVGELAARIATRLGVDDEQVKLLRVAGSLHDIGKLAIPAEILHKRGPLTPEERALVERHPQIGSTMVERLGVGPVAAWVLHHHERWDGAGYPHGLPGEAIPVGARILFVADAYDAMTSERSYRPRLEPFAALAELERSAGTQFDPEIVAALAEELGFGAPIPALAASGV